MTARVVAELWCDRCGSRATGATARSGTGGSFGAPDGTAIGTVSELLDVASLRGWSRLHGYADETDLCPSCTDDRGVSARAAGVSAALPGPHRVEGDGVTSCGRLLGLDGPQLDPPRDTAASGHLAAGRSDPTRMPVGSAGDSPPTRRP